MQEHFYGLTPAEDELLTLLAEECSEVIKAVCKIQRHGLRSYNPHGEPGVTNLDTLIREMGDVRAAMKLLCDIGMIDNDAVINDAANKLTTVHKWLHHN